MKRRTTREALQAVMDMFAGDQMFKDSVGRFHILIGGSDHMISGRLSTPSYYIIFNPRTCRFDIMVIGNEYGDWVLMS